MTESNNNSKRRRISLSSSDDSITAAVPDFSQDDEVFNCPIVNCARHHSDPLSNLNTLCIHIHSQHLLKSVLSLKNSYDNWPMDDPLASPQLWSFLEHHKRWICNSCFKICCRENHNCHDLNYNKIIRSKQQFSLKKHECHNRQYSISPSPGTDQRSDWLSIFPDVLLDLRKRGIPTITRFPARYLPGPRVCNEYLRILTAIYSHPHNLNNYVELLVFPLAIFQRRPQCFKDKLSQRQFSANRLTLWLEGQNGKLIIIQELLNYKQEIFINHDDTDSLLQKNLKKCVHMMNAFRFRDAVQALESHGVHEVDDHIISELKRLHPPRTHPVHYDGVKPPPGSLTVENVKIAIQKFNKMSACGKDGLRAEHLWFITKNVDIEHNIWSALTDFLNLLYSGSVPQNLAPLFASAPLTPLKKSLGGVRPIAVGEVFRRLVSQLGMKTTYDKWHPFLNPDQVGVGTPNGVEFTYFILEDIVAKNLNNPNLAVYKLTFQMHLIALIAMQC